MLYSTPSSVNNSDILQRNFSGRLVGSGGANIRAYREAGVELKAPLWYEDELETFEDKDAILDVVLLEFERDDSLLADDGDEELEVVFDDDDVGGGQRLRNSLYLVFSRSKGLAAFFIPFRYTESASSRLESSSTLIYTNKWWDSPSITLQKAGIVFI